MGKRKRSIKGRVLAHLLGSNARASCQGIESNSLTEEHFPDRSPYGGAVLYWLKYLAFLDVPFDSELVD